MQLQAADEAIGTHNDRAARTVLYGSTSVTHRRNRRCSPHAGLAGLNVKSCTAPFATPSIPG
jgi:hypothetical protein